MERKLFLSDLDGTLLTSEKKVSPATREALERFVGRGGRFCICTGRALPNAMDEQKKLGLDYPGSFVVGYNGAEIYDCDHKKHVFRTTVPLEDVPGIFETAKEHGVHIQTYQSRYIVAEKYSEEMAYYRKIIHSPVIITDHVMDEVKEAPCKILAIELKDREKNIRLKHALEERFGDHLYLMFSNPWYLEIVPKDASKGKALEKIRDYLGLRHEETMAAGDEENDIPMIRSAGLGIAMKNGTEAAKRSADAVTEEDNDHDGLVPFLT